MLDQFKTLLSAKIKGFRSDNSGSTLKLLFRIFFFGSIALGLWLIAFGFSYWLLYKITALESVGIFLAKRALDIILMTFMSVLLISNIITAFGTFFLSEDLHLINSAPVNPVQFYFARFTETIVHSSWMVFIFGLPVLLAYGLVLKVSFIYYFIMPLLLLCFIIIASATGTTITIVLVNVFPARFAREAMMFIGIVAFVALYVLFRMTKPEQFLDPDGFNNLVDLLKSFSTPGSMYMPSHWLTVSLFNILEKKNSIFCYELFMLISTTFAIPIIGCWFSLLLYDIGWSRAQEGKKTILKKIVKKKNSVFKLPDKLQNSFLFTFFIKDLKIFVRDTTQWSQLILLVAIVVIYLYNFSFFKLTGLTGLLGPRGFYFLNVGLAGFLISSLAVRFVFPSISLEGRAFWLIKAAPIKLSDFILGKFWSNVLPLLIVAECLSIASNLMLEYDIYMVLLASVTLFFIVFAVTGVSLGFGAIYPNFNSENLSKVYTGIGGISSMIATIVVVVLLIVLSAPSVFVVSWLINGTRIVSKFEIGLAIFTFLLEFVITLLMIYLPIKYGVKHLTELES